MSGTVIGVMARAPIPGRCKTRLGREIGDVAAASLYAAMLADRIAAIAGLEVDRRCVLVAPEDDGARVLRALAPPAFDIVEQRGADLGERLLHAFEDLFASAPEGSLVAIVDSDSPMAPLEGAWEAARRDTTADALFGPCEDGGYFLVAMRRLHAPLFSDIPWSTPAVLETTHRRGQRAGLTLRDLDRGWDVDTRDDVRRLVPALSREPARAPHTARWLAAARPALEATP